MELREEDGKFVINIPFEANPIFKRAFKRESPRWDSLHKAWKLNATPGNREKLEKIRPVIEDIEQVVDVDTAIVALQNLLMRLKVDAKVYERKLDRVRMRALEREKLIAAIDIKADQVRSLSDAIGRHQQYLNETSGRVHLMLDALTDIRAVIELKDGMLRDRWSVAGKDAFIEKQAAIRELYQPVVDAGFKIEAVEQVIGAQFNRKQRDDFSNIPNDDFYELVIK
jgi:hypothetical protein